VTFLTNFNVFRFCCGPMLLVSLAFNPLLFGQQTGGTDSAGRQDDQTVPPKIDQQKPPFKVAVADGAVQFTVPGVWEQVKPQSNVIDVEIKIVRLEKDQPDGRLTLSGAGGSIEANLDRWKSQFSENTAETKVEVKTIANQTVHLIDLTGTFVDAPGGMFSNAPKIERKDYRMLGAIVQTKGKGNYFVKFYGPISLVEKNQKLFEGMVNSLQVTE